MPVLRTFLHRDFNILKKVFFENCTSRRYLMRNIEIFQQNYRTFAYVFYWFNKKEKKSFVLKFIFKQSFFFNGVQSFFNPKLRFSIESKEKSSPDLTITWRHVGDENVQKYRLYLDDVEIHEVNWLCRELFLNYDDRFRLVLTQSVKHSKLWYAIGKSVNPILSKSLDFEIVSDQFYCWCSMIQHWLFLFFSKIEKKRIDLICWNLLFLMELKKKWFVWTMIRCLHLWQVCFRWFCSFHSFFFFF